MQQLTQEKVEEIRAALIILLDNVDAMDLQRILKPLLDKHWLGLARVSDMQKAYHALNSLNNSIETNGYAMREAVAAAQRAANGYL